MTEQHKNKVHVLVALDCIIFGFDENELKLLLINRGFEPEMGKCSLMGAFYYQFDQLKYEKSINNGLSFVIKP